MAHDAECRARLPIRSASSKKSPMCHALRGMHVLKSSYALRRTLCAMRAQ
jgi:hypothetical protein